MQYLESKESLLDQKYDITQFIEVFYEGKLSRSHVIILEPFEMKNVSISICIFNTNRTFGELIGYINFLILNKKSSNQNYQVYINILIR